MRHVREFGLYPVGSISHWSSFTTIVPTLVFRKTFNDFFFPVTCATWI